MSNFFKVLKRSNRSKARLGEITTSHGKIKTPAFVPVASKGTLKTLLPTIIKDIGIQTAFVNTYHLTTHPGVDLIEKAGGIHKFSRLNFPLMSDSGGFQVFSLAQNKRQADVRGEEQPLLVKISPDGVKFRSLFDGRLIEFTAEKSIEYQSKIGADIIMAFDECTPYHATSKYTKKAMERTHNWLARCIRQNQKSKVKSQNDNSKLKIKKQFLYGIIQGGSYKDLRIESAKFVTSQDIDGVAIGGVSVGESKQEMRDQVGWVADYLPKDKPVHLLGVGQFDDIIDLVKYGIDTFDCVEPTRLARMGKIYQSSRILSEVSLPSVLAISDRLKKSLRAAGILFEPEPQSRRPSSSATHDDFSIDILKTIYKTDLSQVDEQCSCYVCQNFSKAYLHHLFKQKEILAYSLVTYHNLWVMERFFEKIRLMIEENKI